MLSFIIILKNHTGSSSANNELNKAHATNYFNIFMITDNKDLYIAMRQGVLRIVSFADKPGYEWYIPK